MQKFLFKLFKFISIPFALVLLFEIGISFYHENMFSEKNLEPLFYKEISDYKWISNINSDKIIVLAGSSSVRYSLSCSKLNELNPDSSIYVNIAMDARDPIATFFIIKHLDIKKISEVYFGLDPWIYAKKYYKHRNRHLYLDFKFTEFLKYSKKEDRSAFLKRYKSLLSFFINRTKPCKEINYNIPYDFGSAVLNRTAVNFSDLADLFQIESYGWSDLQFIYLKKIQDYCFDNNVKFTIFIPPKRSDYSESYKSKFINIHHEYVNKLVENGIRAQVFGKFNELDAIGDSLFFVDNCHLNEKGQKKYSEIFYEMTLSKSERFTLKYNWFRE
jgi:hypothetical protein